ncbi:MAG: TIGR04086 family membrane protein, partial [Limnochordales bacterium]
MRVRLLSVLQGVGLAFAAAVVGALVLGLVAAWAPVWDPSDGLLKAINVAAVAAGGVYAGRKAPRLGWLHGGAAGLLYVVLA